MEDEEDLSRGASATIRPTSGTLFGSTNATASGCPTSKPSPAPRSSIGNPGAREHLESVDIRLRDLGRRVRSRQVSQDGPHPVRCSDRAGWSWEGRCRCPASRCRRARKAGRLPSCRPTGRQGISQETRPPGSRPLTSTLSSSPWSAPVRSGSRSLRRTGRSASRTPRATPQMAPASVTAQPARQPASAAHSSRALAYAP